MRAAENNSIANLSGREIIWHLVYAAQFGCKRSLNKYDLLPMLSAQSPSSSPLYSLFFPSHSCPSSVPFKNSYAVYLRRKCHKIKNDSYELLSSRTDGPSPAESNENDIMQPRAATDYYVAGNVI